jgi:hypothetical protein
VQSSTCARGDPSSNAMRSVKYLALASCAFVGGCWETNTRSIDAAVIPSDSRVDVGPDAPTYPCESDLSGTWQIVYSPECRQAPELREGPFPIGLPDCAQRACDSTNCIASAPVAPLCERATRLESPCAGTPRGMGLESSDRVVSPDRVEGSWRIWNDMEVITCSYFARRVR